MSRCHGVIVRQQKVLMPPVRRCKKRATSGDYCEDHAPQATWQDAMRTLLRPNWDEIDLTAPAPVESPVSPASCQEEGRALPSREEATAWLHNFYTGH